MSLPHALLGLINYKPLTGYDLKATFNGSINFFWNASLPQIYRTLHQMETSGWVLSNIEQQKGKPNRKIYTITDKGKEELRKWLGEHSAIEQNKSELMIKVFFGNQMNHQDLVNQIRERREQAKKELQQYENVLTQTADQIATTLDVNDDKRFWLLTVDCGIRYAKMIAEWCDTALEILEK